MADGDLHAFVHNLCQRLSAGSAAGLSDAELLGRWTAGRDEAAFELLLRRHAPLVLGVCRRLLPHPQDVEDAFQAVFLLLVRKATAIRRGASVAGWLYRVAYRVALRARSARPRLPCALPDDLAALPASADEELVWRDLRPVLDEEVCALPEKYRSAFVLCHLQGKTNQEAADVLGCPLGTVLSRLSWARQRLRSRLARRGLAVSTAVLGEVLARNAAAAPAALLQATLTTSVRPVAGAASARPFLLAEGVSKAMFFAKVKLTVAAATAACVLALGTLVRTHRTEAAPVPGGLSPAPAPPAEVSARNRNWVMVPAPHEGILEVIGRTLKAGEKVPADRLVSIRVDGKMRQYCRLGEGDRVDKGDLLAHLNDALARKDLDIKRALFAASEADWRSATKTKEEAKNRYDACLRANQRTPGTISAEEARGHLLNFERYKEEEISKAKTVEVSRLEVEKARTILELHEIRSPVDGVIEVVLKKDGEAVKRLEPVFRIRTVRGK